MYPIKNIVKSQNSSCLKFIYNLVTPYKTTLLKLFILSIVISITSVISSFFFQGLIDNINNNIKYLCLAFISIFIIKILADYFRNRILIKFSNSLDQTLTQDTFKQIIELPYLYYHNHTTGEVISRINDLKALRDIISKAALTIFIDLPLTMFSGILLWNINKFLFIIVIVILILYILILVIYKKRIYLSIDKVTKNKAEVNSYMVEGIGGFETIKGLNLENKIVHSFNNKYQKLIKNNIKLDKIINNQYLLKDLTNTLGQVLIMIIGIMLVKNNQLTLGTLITYNALVSLFLEPIRNIIDLDFETKEAVNALRRVLDLFDGQSKKSNENLKGNIEFKNLSYSFDDINPILKSINLKIEGKSKVLMTGKSGSGKSTLLKILKGYYPYEGEILINGKQVNNQLNKVVYLSPKETLFTGTVNYNLTIKSSEDLANIKNICYTDEIVVSNDLGYNFLLEEDGFNISEGQRQRLALARALHDFDILIIDEGLNGTDINLERKILKKLFSYFKNKTIIVISHRLDNLDLYDQFIQMENGKIIQNETKAK